MNRNTILVVMIVVIASPFLFHFQESPQENAPKVAVAAFVGLLSLSCLASGGFTKWVEKMKHPPFALFWILVILLGTVAPLVALKFQ